MSAAGACAATAAIVCVILASNRRSRDAVIRTSQNAARRTSRAARDYRASQAQNQTP